MTTIATDGKSMAADGMITDNDVVCLTNYVKIRRLSDGRIVGFSGDAFNYDAFAEWLEKGEGEPPKLSGQFSCLALRPDGSVVQYDDQGRSFPEMVPMAIGSGMRFAIAAMDLGKSAEQAVRYACTRDIYSGGEIAVLHRSVRTVEAA